MNKRVLSLCDYTGNMVKPWAEAGYECWIVDIQHNPTGKFGNILKIEADILDWAPPAGVEFDFISCFPPCTDLAVSGARWFKEKGLKRLAKAIEVFGRCVEIAEQSGAPYCIENPVSVISSHYRKPDYTFDPCDYGDPYTKKTCLWAGGGFVMPEKNRVDPVLGSKMHLIPPSENRANLRSETPPGFARAVFEANHRRRAS